MTLTAKQLRRLCPQVDEAFLERHLARLGPRYFECFSESEIARHATELAALSPEKPVAVLIERLEDNRVECAFLAFDYRGEFSLLAGILAGMGFNIQSGDIFTYARETATTTTRSRVRQFLRRRSRGLERDVSAAPRRCVIDRFQGFIDPNEDFDEWAEMLGRQTLEIILQVERGAIDAARNQVNEMVTSRLEQIQWGDAPILYPIDLAIDNEAGPWTRLKVVSEDTPAFLYSLSAALSLKGVSIERVVIRTIEGRIQDEIDFVNAAGEKVADEEALRQIKLSVLFTKQFTYFLPKAPDPYAALTRFDNLLQDVMRLPESGQWVERFSQTRNLDGLARVLGTSDFIWEDFIRLQHEVLAPVLESQRQGQSFFQRETLAERLEQELAGVSDIDEQIRRLNRFKDHEIFLIDLDHILGAHTYDPRPLAENLTTLAEHVVRATWRLAYQNLAKRYGVPRTVGGIEAACAVMGLGKLGGVALGYASDVELLFVYSDNGHTDGAESIGNSEFYERLVQDFRNSIKAKREGIFEIDLQLRPFGNDGPLACSLEAFCRYFGPGGEARAYERLALVRLRGVGGDTELCARVERLRDEFVYAAHAIDIPQLREMRKKQYAEKTGARPNAKFSPGALVDLEYDVQILQAMYAQQVPSLKTPRIHEALDALLAAGMVTQLEKDRLSRAYYFLRRLINGLRMLRGNARDLFLPPPESDEFHHLARRMGYERVGDLARAQQLYLDFETHTAAVRAFVERHFGRETLPGPATGNVADLLLSDHAPSELSEKILRNIGLTNTRRGLLNLRRLAGDGARRERFAMLAVLACDMLKGKADPDMALNNWERFAAALPDPAGHFERLLSQPKRLDILLSVFASSQFLSDTLARNPEFFDWATSPENINRALRRDGLDKELREVSASSPNHPDFLDAIRRFRRRHILRIGTRDICLHAPIQQVTSDLSVVAESLVQVALERYWEARSTARTEGKRENASHLLPSSYRSDSSHPSDPSHPSDSSAPAKPADRFCILAFGKLGGSELNYSSDIDLIAVYDGPPDPSFAAAIGQVREDLSAHTAEGYAYRVDLRLRAYGRSGQLAQPLASLVAYYRAKASPWEKQALLKLRPIAGAVGVGDSLLRQLRFVFQGKRPRNEIATAIESLRSEGAAKAGRRKGAAARKKDILGAALNVKEGVGGIRDIEFLVQGLQLIHAQRDERLIEANTLKALAALEEAKAIPSDVARQLRDDYALLRRVEHFLQIMEDRQIHALPEDETELTAIARRVIGPAGTAEALREGLAACVQRVRAAYQTYLLETPE